MYVWSFYPEVAAWHFAISWLLGSILFVAEASGLLLQTNDAISKRWTINFGICGLVGSCLFAYGAIWQFLEVLQVPVQYDPATQLKRSPFTTDNQPSDTKSSEPHTNRKGSNILSDSSLSVFTRVNLVFNQWSRIDYVASVIQLVGAILFLIATVVEVGWWKSTVTPGYAPGGNSGLFEGLNTACHLASTSLFSIGGYLTVVEMSQKWYGGLPTSISVAAMYGNLIGGLGFLCSAVLWIFYYRRATMYLLEIPLLIGSVAYTFSSYYYWYVQCSGYNEK